MAGVEQNLEIWSEYDWALEGDEWSEGWGDTASLWHGALMPRIHPFLPAKTILEIAPGHGRWTSYLKDLCDRLVIVDLTERCIEHCRRRFGSVANIDYHVNDGRSLAMVEDETIDLAFSFDSLVHADMDVLDAYLSQLATKLRPEGVGFIHHSNAGNLKRLATLTRRAPDAVRAQLISRGVLIDIGAWRSETVTAELVADACERAGLRCVTQEKISWMHGRHLTDCLTTFTRAGSRWERRERTHESKSFSIEGRRAAALYAQSSFLRRVASPAPGAPAASTRADGARAESAR